MRKEKREKRKILIVALVVFMVYMQYRTIEALQMVGANQQRIYEVLRGEKYWPTNYEPRDTNDASPNPGPAPQATEARSLVAGDGN